MKRDAANRSRAITWRVVSGAAVLLIWTFFPIAWVILTSLKGDRLQFSIPPVLLFPPTLVHYARLLHDADFSRFYLNSLAIAVFSTSAVLAVAIPAAYAHARLRFPGRTASLALLIGIRTMPPVTVVVPLFIYFRRLGLMDTYLGMVLLYTAFFAPFGVLMLKTFFDGVPQEVDDAAAIDGASPIRRLLLHLTPIGPGVAAVAVLSFISSWNEFLFAFVFTAREAKTIPVALAMFVGETGIDWGTMTAGATVVMVPSVVLAWLVQRHLVRGLTAGALK